MPGGSSRRTALVGMRSSLPAAIARRMIRRRCHRQLFRPEFPRADHRGVGGVAPPLGLLAARHTAQAPREAGVIKQPANNRDPSPIALLLIDAPRLHRAREITEALIGVETRSTPCLN